MGVYKYRPTKRTSSRFLVKLSRDQEAADVPSSSKGSRGCALEYVPKCRYIHVHRSRVHVGTLEWYRAKGGVQGSHASFSSCEVS
jgi:hypothetical protein